MPVPNPTGTQGTRRLAPASARTQARSFSRKAGHALKLDGAKPPAWAAPRGGQVPAMPRARPAAPRSAIHYPAPHPQRPCYLGVLSKKGERKQNSQEKFNTFGESEIAADTV